MITAKRRIDMLHKVRMGRYKLYKHGKITFTGIYHKRRK